MSDQSNSNYVMHSDLKAKLEKFKDMARSDFVNLQIDEFTEYKYEKGILEGIDRLIKFLHNELSK